MVRVLLTILFFIYVSTNICYANNGQILADAIQSYKNQNYEECITKMKAIVKNDPTSAVGYYYLGLSYSKTGKKLLAIQNYNKVISLGSDKTLINLAEQGKVCAGGKNITAIEAQLEELDENNETNNKVGEKLNGEVNKDISKDENSKNSKTATKETPKTTKVIKASDYANSNAQPTNDEIVNAIRVLQKAGLLGAGVNLGANGQNPNGYNNGMNGMPQMDAKTQQMNAMLMMMQNGNNNNGMMNMMPFMNGSNGKINPEMIQMMMMNQMMPNFSTGNNNNGY